MGDSSNAGGRGLCGDPGSGGIDPVGPSGLLESPLSLATLEALSDRPSQPGRSLALTFRCCRPALGEGPYPSQVLGTLLRAT